MIALGLKTVGDRTCEEVTVAIVESRHPVGVRLGNGMISLFQLEHRFTNN